MEIKKILLSVVICITLYGCASTKEPLLPLPEDQMEQAVSAVLATAPSQGTDSTVEELKRIADRNPVSGLPWVHIAKLRFDNEQYGPAIVAADEALQRDPNDFVAKSIRVVGGLRIALASLADMKDNAMLAGNARPDAEALAQAMRESLGQEVLFPKGRKPRSHQRTAPKPAAPAASATPAAANAATSPSPSRTSTAAPSAPSAQPPTQAPAAIQQPPAKNRNPFDGLLNTLPE
jgi:hypothetical protein